MTPDERYETVRHCMGSGEGYTFALAALDEMRKDSERLEWYFSFTPKPQNLIGEYLKGMREHWTVDQWREFIDKGMRGISNDAR